MDQTSVRTATGTGRTALALVAILSLLLSFFAITRPVAADHSGFSHQPLPIDTSEFGADEEECEDADLEPGQVLLHWIASHQNTTDPITLTLTLDDETTLSEDSYKWNTPAQIDDNVTHHFEFIIDSGDVVIDDLELSTGEGNVRLSHVCRGEENGGEEGETLVLVKQDADENTLDGVGFTLGAGAEMFTVGGMISFTDLAEGSFLLTETSNPDEDCETGGTLTVMVSATGVITVTDDDETDGLAIVSFNATTNTLVLANDCEENGGEEGEGSVEIDKLFCSSDEGTRTEIEVNDPVTPGSFRVQGQAPENGCAGGEASFTIYAADENGDPIGEPVATSMTDTSGDDTFDLDAGTYVIVEDASGASATFTVEADALTIIEVTNFESGLVKVIKLFCEGDQDGVLFSIDGSAVTGFDPDTCEDGDAAFRIDDGDTFTTEDGEALVFAEVGTHTLTEVAPNAATSGTFEVALAAEGEFEPVTVIRVFDIEGGEGGPGGEETVTVSLMKHLCTDVSNVEEFEAVEAEGAAAYPGNAFAPLAFTVLACPTIVLTGDVPTTGAVSGGNVDFEFSVIDAGGQQILSDDGMFEQAALCETDVMVDADGDGSLEADVCLDTSHYTFEVVDGAVVITETEDPDGSTGLGTLRFTPGSGDETALATSIGVVETTGVITLDTSMASDAALADGMIMLHLYNFATPEEGGVSPETSSPPQTSSPEQGVQGTTGTPAGTVSDTSTASGSSTVPVLPFMLLVLVGLGAMAGLNVVTVRARQ